MIIRLSDVAPAIDLLRQKGTGPFRTNRPVYSDLMPPCNDACPAGENVQAWLDLAQAGKYRQAWEAIVADNPFPAIHGRVCYHPCETHCSRASLDSAVSIHSVERFLGDTAVSEDWPLPPPAASNGKRVLVVGAGPSGLSAAYHLARRGYAVEIHDAGSMPGGMLHYGIPAYRLPRSELMGEIDRITAMGVVLILNRQVDDIVAEQAKGRFDAVYAAIGAQKARHVDIPARDAGRVFDAVAVLHAVETGPKPQLGRRVVVYGGGDTAIDAARTARRLGAEDAMIVYRSDQSHMKAQPVDAQDAVAEGIQFRWLSKIKSIGEGELTVEVMSLDTDGALVATGAFETLGADSVILALGQLTDSNFLSKTPGVAFSTDGMVVVDAQMMTGRAGLFAGGDMTAGDRTVTVAVGRGKAAARHIDQWVRNTQVETRVRHRVVEFAELNLPIYADAPLSIEPQLPVAERLTGLFPEIIAGLDEHHARHEARRCLSCGNCFECDQCLAACPVDAIVKLGPGQGYCVDFDVCNGCGACVEQCPCHAIEMAPEPAPSVSGDRP